MADGEDQKPKSLPEGRATSGMEKAEIDEGRDRLSELPDTIIQDILQYLSYPKEIERTKLLSKRWRHIVPYSLASVVLDEIYWPSSYRGHGNKIRTDPTRFERYVDRIMKRLRENAVKISKFELRLCVDHRNWVVGDWMEMAINSSAKEICFGMYDLRGFVSSGCFPASVLIARTLESLTIRGNCVRFRDYLFSVQISLPCLKRLELCRVRIEEAIIHEIIDNCPKLEELLLLEVGGVRKLQLTNHVMVKYVMVHHYGSFEVEAPTIERLVFRAGSRFQQFKLTAMENLRFLEIDYCCMPILGGVLREAISRLPVLEVLHLMNCSGLEKMEIRSNSIKEIQLECCDDLLAIEIYAPNLCRFYRSSSELLKFIRARYIQVYWQVKLSDRLTCSSWLAKLKESLDEQSPFKIFFVSCISCSKEKEMKLQEFENLNVLRTVPKIDHLNLHLFASCESCFAAIAMSVLWNCRPRLLTFGTSTETKYIELLFKELQKIAASDCCKVSGSKCWRHYLKYVNYVSFIEAVNSPLSYYDSHYYNNGKSICLKLDWDV